MERLDKYLCDCDLGTRSQVKLVLKAGRVSVNGKTEKDGSRKIDESSDTVCLDGESINAKGSIVLMMNKPTGYITATEDALQKTVMDLLPAQYRNRKLNPIGRLDKDTEGLLLFTDDGELLHHLISPSHRIPKKYIAVHEGIVSEADIAAFADGILLKDGTQCLPADLEIAAPGKSIITVYEGKYHQVRRMMASRGMHVLELRRIQEGMLKLGNLPSGEVRELTREEIDALS